MPLGACDAVPFRPPPEETGRSGLPLIERLLWLKKLRGVGRLRIVFLLLGALPMAGCVASGNPAPDTRPFAESECERIVSKDLGEIKYCQRGDYAEIIRLDDGAASAE